MAKVAGCISASSDVHDADDEDDISNEVKEGDSSSDMSAGGGSTGAPLKRPRPGGKRKKRKLYSTDSVVPLCPDKPEPDIIARDDPYYQLKRTILNTTYRLTTTNAVPYFHRISNIFVKNWRFSKQFKHVQTNSRAHQSVLDLFRQIVKELYAKELILVKGPEESTCITELVTMEIARDNNKLFSRAPPTLTVLITAPLFDKYFQGSGLDKSDLLDTTGDVKPAVVLKDTGDDWEKVRLELGASTHDDVASILIHCYRTWSSVVCGRCRRHMDLSMEQKLDKVVGKNTAVCVVSCECGLATSGGFMIECDSCHKWQHGVCVGIEQDRDIPGRYACTRCTKRDTYREERVKKQEESDESVVSVGNDEIYSTDDSQPEVIDID